MDVAGYFDLQVNGYSGVDFNSDQLTAEELSTALVALGRDGVERFLPTIITDHIPTMCSRLARLTQCREELPLAKQMIPGLHLEGPFLNESDGYRGAHPRDAIQSATPDAMKKLLDAANGVIKLVTLAPECDPGLK